MGLVPEPSVKKHWWIELVDEVLLEVKAEADAFIKEFIKPIGDIGNPERVIGKPYAEWTPQDLMRLRSMYGKDQTKLDKFIFDKAFEELQTLEEAV